MENNFSSEDCIMITRIFFNKLKKILTLSVEFKKNKNLDLTISTAKPPIFWKDKDLVKMQIKNWTTKNIEDLIFQINQIELKIKKNSHNAMNIVLDFIIKSCSKISN